MKKGKTLAWSMIALWALWALSACGNKNANTETHHEEKKDTAKAAIVNVPEEKKEEKPKASLEMFAGFKGTTIDVKAGDRVMVPEPVSYAKLEKGKWDGLQVSYFNSYEVASVGDGVLSLKESQYDDKTFDIPNYLAIPIKKEKIKKGDLVLSNGNSSGPVQPHYVNRVVDAENVAIVSFGNIFIDKPDFKDKIKDISVKNTTCRVVNEAWEAGTSFVVKNADNTYSIWNVVNVSETQVIGEKRFEIKVFEKANCTPLTLRPKFKKGDKVQIEFSDKLTNATVDNVNAEYGIAYVKYDKFGSFTSVPIHKIATGFTVE